MVPCVASRARTWVPSPPQRLTHADLQAQSEWTPTSLPRATEQHAGRFISLRCARSSYLQPGEERLQVVHVCVWLWLLKNTDQQTVSQGHAHWDTAPWHPEESKTGRVKFTKMLGVFVQVFFCCCNFFFFIITSDAIPIFQLLLLADVSIHHTHTAEDTRFHELFCSVEYIMMLYYCKGN